MNYAIIPVSGKQYIVTENEEILVDRMDKKKGETIVFDKVLLLREGEKVYIGSPYVENTVVLGKVLDEIKGDKIHVSKFKAKVRYRKKIGFRPIFTKILIDKIQFKEKILKPRKTAKKIKNS